MSRHKPTLFEKIRLLAALPFFLLSIVLMPAWARDYMLTGTQDLLQ